jgi:maltose-binding protein MalE
MSELGALPTFPKYAAATKVMGDNLNAAKLGQMSAEDALKKIDTDLNALMKAP